MNDPEVTMSPALPTRRTGLEAHTYALGAACVVLQLVQSLPAPLRFLADQASRAACSAVLNLAEGNGRSGRDRQHHWRIAYASAKETMSALELLAGSGAVADERAAEASRLLDSVCAMTWRLLHPRR
jgi:four helix bundle protein